MRVRGCSGRKRRRRSKRTYAVEEALELYWSKGNDDSVEELADILEVIQGTCKAFGITFEELQSIANNKKDKRGGFDEGILLVATQEN